jgi:undecaprenyl-diphosphatase
VELKDALKAGATYAPLPLLIGICSAALVSWLAIAWLLEFLKTNSTWPFVVYRLLFGALLLGLVAGNPTLG